MDDHDLYGADYFLKHYQIDPKRHAMYKQEHARILARVPNMGSVLDIGCGVGDFLGMFDDRWEKMGFEPSQYAADVARRKGVVIVHSLEKVEDESVDLVVFRGTLQHINTPINDLAEATRVLRHTGMLAILATPDINSLVYKLWHDLPPLEAPRNWVLFDGHYLSNILRRLGYNDVSILHPYLGTPYARPLSDFSKFFISLFFGYRKFAFPGNMMEVYARIRS